MKRLLGLFAGIWVSLQTIHAQCALLYELPLEARVEAANYIVEGEIIASRAFESNESRLIYTAYTLKPYRIFKGQAVPKTLEILVEGGQVGNRLLVVHPETPISIGQKGLFLLNPMAIKQGLYTLEAGPQGIIRYDENQRIAADAFKVYPDLVQNLYTPILHLTRQTPEVRQLYTMPLPRLGKTSLATPTISSFSPTTVTAGTGTVLTINGANFGSATNANTRVYFANANDGGATYVGGATADVVSWSNTQIQVKVSTGAGTGKLFVVNDLNEQSALSASTLTVSYNLTTVGTTPSRTVLVNDNGSGGYNLVYSTATANSGVSFYDHSTAKAAFERALNTWKAASGYNLTITGSSSVGAQSDDDSNVIMFDNASAALSSGVLGVAYSYYWKYGADAYWRLGDLDIRFKRSETGNISWNFGTGATPNTCGVNNYVCYDFESVALHELGHTHQLGHVIDNTQTMHYSITNGQDKRSLATNEVNAALDVRGISTPSPYNYSPASLPVRLGKFDGDANAHRVKLVWETLSELNTEGFEIQHKVGNEAFKALGFIRSQGDSQASRNYQYITDDLMPGLHVFRLRVLDFDGHESYSPELSVLVESDQPFGFSSVYPNPFNPTTTFYISVTRSQNVNIKVYNALGQEVQSLFSGTLASNEIQRFQFDGLSLPAGLYFIRAKGETFLSSQRAVLMK